MTSPILIFTGGHHNSGLATAQHLRQTGWEVIWIGHRYSMWGDKNSSAEFREVTEAGIQFIDLKAGKFYRTYHPVKLLRIPFGFIRAFIILIGLKIKYGTHLKGIVSFGGYLGLPVVVCGWLLGIPAITHEQTMSPGYANLIMAFLAKKIATSWTENRTRFPASKVVFTGLPLRPEIRRLKPLPQTAVHRPPRLLILCGKQGSHAINQLIFRTLPQLISHYSVVHQIGSFSLHHDFSNAQARISSRYRPYDYLSPSQLAEKLSWADVIVSRSGAHVTYEYAYLGKRSVLIPLPNSSRNEQMYNAEYLKNSGLAIILPQDKLTPDSLLVAISQALKLKPLPRNLPADGIEKLSDLIIQTFNVQT